MGKIKRKKCKCHNLKKREFIIACNSGCETVKSCFQFYNCFPKCGKCTPFVKKLLKIQ